MAVRIRTSRARRNQQIVQEYRQEHGDIDTVDLRQVSEWAVRTGRWKRELPTPEKLCYRELSRALRLQQYTDPQGREVRVMHPARTEQGVLWADIHTAQPGHMRISLQQRRAAILDDCRQHKTDAESYNENNIHGTRLPLFDYNFNPDLEELQYPTEYPEAKPGEEEDEDEDY